MYVLTENDKKNGWVEHVDDFMPEHLMGKTVQLLFRGDDFIWKGNTGAPEMWRWEKYDSSVDIIAYRIISQDATQRKYTIKELREIYNDVEGVSLTTMFLSHLEDQEKLEQDPDYQKYLELKERFEN